MDSVSENHGNRLPWLDIPIPSIVAAYVLFHGILWTVVPFFRNHNLPLDVIEHIAWGREWQLGYHKHPPMTSWLLELVISVFGRADLAIYALSQVCIAISFIFIWKLARSFFAPLPALIATLLCEGVIYHGFTSPEFNVNVASLPFWAASIFLASRLYTLPDKGRINPGWGPLLQWVFLGISVAGALLAKYTAILLMISLIILFAMPPAWHWWRTKGPYLAITAFAIFMAPHIAWLVLNDFPTFGYALARGTGDEGGFLHRVLAPIGFAGSQLPAILPAIIVLLVGLPWRMSAPCLTDRRDQVLLILGLGPLLILMVIAFGFSLELKSMWGTTLFLTLGLYLVHWLGPAQTPRSRKRLMLGVLVVFLLGPLAYAIEPAIANRLLERPKRTQFPGAELASAVDARWQKTFDRPLEMVIGDEWLAGNVSYYSEDRPSAFLNASPIEAPWANMEMLSESGGVVVWTSDKYGSEHINLSDTKYLNLLDGFAVWEQEPIVLPWNQASLLPQVTVGWAIIPPQMMANEPKSIDKKALKNNLRDARRGKRVYLH